jgi:hypothetical protein
MIRQLGGKGAEGAGGWVTNGYMKGVSGQTDDGPGLEQ